jgi:hypothetical protein
MQTPGPNDGKKETDLQKEMKFLAEDSKVNFIMDMLSNIRFGKLTIQKFNGKIVGYSFDGEVKFVIPEYGPKKGPGQT